MTVGRRQLTTAKFRGWTVEFAPEVRSSVIFNDGCVVVFLTSHPDAEFKLSWNAVLRQDSLEDVKSWFGRQMKELAAFVPLCEMVEL